MARGRLDADLEHRPDEHERGDASVAQHRLDRGPDQRRHRQLVEHRLVSHGGELGDDPGLRGFRREGGPDRLGSVGSLPRHRGAERARRRGAIGGSDTWRTYRTIAPAARAASRTVRMRAVTTIRVLHVREDADLGVVHEHRGGVGAAHLRDRLRDLQAEGILHRASVSAAAARRPGGPAARRQLRRLARSTVSCSCGEPAAGGSTRGRVSSTSISHCSSRRAPMSAGWM